MIDEWLQNRKPDLVLPKWDSRQIGWNQSVGVWFQDGKSFDSQTDMCMGMGQRFSDLGGCGFSVVECVCVVTKVVRTKVDGEDRLVKCEARVPTVRGGSLILAVIVLADGGWRLEEIQLIGREENRHPDGGRVELSWDMHQYPYVIC